METAQSTADGAVSVNANQSARLTALEKTASTTVGCVTFARRGKVVTAFFSTDVNHTVAAWATKKVCDIPVGYRPSQNAYSSLVFMGGAGRMTTANNAINIVTLDKAISNANVWGQVTYFTNDA